jgi:hypothetical protein
MARAEIPVENLPKNLDLEREAVVQKWIRKSIEKGNR